MTLRGPPDSRPIAELLRFGVVPLDKPAGPSAHQVAAWVRELVGEALQEMGHEPIERAAHAGTLDPTVTGCLPTLLGTATRCVPGLQNVTKTYVAVLELHADPPTDLAEVLTEFQGEIYQRPPRKSAVKRRLRTRRIHELSILEADGRQILLRVRCAAGTYIRKLCHDIGLALGTGGHMGDLRRIETRPFDDTNLVTLHDLTDGLAEWTEHGSEEWLREAVHPAEEALVHLPRVTIAPNAAEQVAEGAPVYAPGILAADEVETGSRVACFTPDGAVVCIGHVVGDPAAAEGEVIDLERVLV